MEQNLNQSREHGGWAPLVGVALAALMIGSLMLFSTIAQRTSLDGFAERGLAAEAPAGDPGRAITLSPVPETDGGSGAAASGDAVAQLDTLEATRLIFEDAPAPTATSTTAFEVASTDTVDAADADAVRSPDSAEPRLAAQDTSMKPFALKMSGGSSAKNDEVAGRNEIKKSDRLGKSSKSPKSRKAKDGRGPKAKRGGGRNGAPPSHANGARGRSASASSSSARPAKSRSARPAPAAKPARPASRPTPRSAHASNRSNQKGKGHSKSRGRGQRP